MEYASQAPGAWYDSYHDYRWEYDSGYDNDRWENNHHRWDTYYYYYYRW